MLKRLGSKMAGRMLPGVIKLEEDLLNQEGTIKYSAGSPERELFNTKRVGTMSPPMSLRMLPRFARLLNPMMKNMKLTITSLENNPSEPKTITDDSFISDLEQSAYDIGIDDIAYTELPREFIFQDRAVMYGKGVVVLSMEMDYDDMEKAPSPTTQSMILHTYNNLGIMTNKLASFLRKNGYGAHAGHPLGGLAVYPPLGQMAGMGWHGLNGILIGPKFGPRHRLSAIYTSIENLPIVKENSHAWVEDFCNQCKRCIPACPGKAIYGAPIIHHEKSRSYIETEKCMPVFLKQHGCSVCIKVCEFNRKDYYSIKEEFLNSR
jgi:ferredoxin